MEKEFPPALRRARKEAGLTQKELASKLGVATGTVQQWELGVRFPRNATIHKISDVLNIPYQVLFYDTDSSSLESFLGRTMTEDEELELRNHVKRFCEEANYSRALKFADSAEGKAIVNAFYMLNDIGVQEAVKRVYELTEIERYKAVRPNHKQDSSPTQEKPSEEQTAPTDGK